MRILVTLVVVAAAAAAPEQPTNSFPKKYEAAVHGAKNTYPVFHHAADEDLLMPALNPLDVLLPPLLPVAPMSEDSYSELGATVGEDTLSPPPEDSYSSVSGVGHSALMPPPLFLAPKAPSSYLSFEEPLRDSLTSSYAETPHDASGTEILASLAAMIRALPRTSSYAAYQPSAAPRTLGEGPSAYLLPPPPSRSSYSNVPFPQPAFSQEQEAPVALPLTGLVPPQ